MPRRIFITVAEVSGDQHAAELITALKQLDPEIMVEGFGGPEMARAGGNILYETTSKAAMTFHAVKRVFEVSRLLKQARRYYLEQKPALQICVDSSGMNLHFARAAKECGVPVLYYIAPQLWASREGRMKKVREFVDHVACILPFEENYYRSHGVTATFVGHPLFDELPADRGRGAGARFPETPAVIGIIPGSRKSEVAANFPHLLDVMKRVLVKFPEARFNIPTTAAGEPVVAKFLEQEKELSLRTTVKRDAFDELISQCDLCITKSGTSTLHVAAWNVPMIVVYRVNPLLWHLAGRWLVKTKRIALVNILAGQIDLVPEFIPWYGPSDEVAECAIDLLEHPEKLVAQREKLAELVKTLEKPGASMNAARIAMELMGRAGQR
ncbi:MAG TPA: lipid-A-disaccharide synthase [Tepidisphaeraceae bacterium]|nr:lipid-A-disaccharide synthase [Tepidisphaeraceae bacterium]